MGSFPRTRPQIKPLFSLCVYSHPQTSVPETCSLKISAKDWSLVNQEFTVGVTGVFLLKVLGGQRFCRFYFEQLRNERFWGQPCVWFDLSKNSYTKNVTCLMFFSADVKQIQRSDSWRSAGTSTWQTSILKYKLEVRLTGNMCWEQLNRYDGRSSLDSKWFEVPVKSKVIFKRTEHYPFTRMRSKMSRKHSL